MDAPPPHELLGRLRAQPRPARLLDALSGVSSAHLVGGAVRDTLLGGEALDLDVVVGGDAAGLEDLGVGRLRVLHDASFRDAPTRLLRLVRYAARLSFAIEPGTRELAEEAARHGALDTVSGARVGEELRLLLGEPRTLEA